MASASAIRAALVAAMTNIPALNAAFPDGYRVSGYPLSNPTPPQIEVAQFGIEKHQAMNNGAEWWTCSIHAYLTVTTDAVSLAAADAFLDNDPLSAAIEADKTLGGTVSDLQVDRIDQRYWDHPQLQAPLAGAEYQVRFLI
jgi:hypothetical protein